MAKKLITLEQLGTAIGTVAQAVLDALNGKAEQEDFDELQTMCLTNNFATPLAVQDADDAILADDDGTALAADWKYKEAST